MKSVPLKGTKHGKHHTQCYSWGGDMGHRPCRPIQQKNGPLTAEIAILNLERMTH